MRLQAVGEIFRAAQVRAIYLLHGSFVGSDALGLLREVARISPRAGDQLRHIQKQLVDTVAGDAGNFTAEYAQRLEAGLAGDAEGGRAPSSLPVRLFHWSSENHHLGRADGAVRLLAELAGRPELAGGRVLLWGHSHGGNVLALLTNLLGADRATRDRFFRAARPYYCWPGIGKVDLPVWPQVQRLLECEPAALATVQLDLVTMGTPVRYGWDASACSRLLHFCHHRAVAGLPPTQARFPFDWNDLMCGKDGDYVQQLGIAGTNLAPPVWAWRTWLADVRLNRILQSGQRRRDLFARLQAGTRVHEQGTNLLVDYGVPTGHFGQHWAGHAVYTRAAWSLFHAEQVARRFYQTAS